MMFTAPDDLSLEFMAEANAKLGLLWIVTPWLRIVETPDGGGRIQQKFQEVVPENLVHTQIPRTAWFDVPHVQQPIDPLAAERRRVVDAVHAILREATDWDSTEGILETVSKISRLAD
jgi:hypothetical protein